eukprot:4579392-Amphidinium_carterae.4
MEPESLAAFGYEVPDSAGVRDKLDKSGLVASIGIASFMSARELDRCAAIFMFVMAAGAAPVRAATTAAVQELIITTNSNHYFDGDVARLIKSALLVSIITVMTIVCSQLLCSQQRTTTSKRDTSTQTEQTNAMRVSGPGPEDIYVYPKGQRYHTAQECTAVTSARSHPRQYTKCRICG